MLENHPFRPFVPIKVKYLLLGSFVVRQVMAKVPGYDWYYCNKVNQFWPILEVVYEKDLKNLEAKKKLFIDLKMAVTDVILACERKADNNSDQSLVNPVFNLEVVTKILEENEIEKIYFTSKFVEVTFRRNFKEIIINYPEIKLVTLPSPSPRYAAMSKEIKIEKYKALLPLW